MVMTLYKVATLLRLAFLLLNITQHWHPQKIQKCNDPLYRGCSISNIYIFFLMLHQQPCNQNHTRMYIFDDFFLSTVLNKFSALDNVISSSHLDHLPCLTLAYSWLPLELGNLVCLILMEMSSYFNNLKDS